MVLNSSFIRTFAPEIKAFIGSSYPKVIGRGERVAYP